MILGGQLERRSSVAEGPRCTIKGAVALEMRLLRKARATRDIDLVVDDLGSADPTAVLRDALEGDYQGFSFRPKGEPYVMPNESVRVQVALDYLGRSWGTVQVDLSPAEGDRTEVEMVEPLGLDPFGLETPGALPCISLRYHIAQKIHAMTEPPLDEATRNERFRDLVDLLLMQELTTDLRGVRAACVDVFAVRAKHGWPPVLEPPVFWEEPFAALAREIELPVRGFKDAVLEAGRSSKPSRRPGSGVGALLIRPTAGSRPDDAKPLGCARTGSEDLSRLLGRVSEHRLGTAAWEPTKDQKNKPPHESRSG